MSNGHDSQSWSNISATPAVFYLTGGTYGVSVVATFGGGSVTLNMLGPDGSTYIAALAAFLTNGYGYLSLPAGQYQLAIATATGVYAAVTGIK